MRITYIGLKPTKTDNVANTGLTWAAGQAHEVASLDACAKLLRHADVWAVADEDTKAPADDLPPADIKPTETVPELDALRARLTDLGIKFHHKAGVDKLRELLPKTTD